MRKQTKLVAVLSAAALLAIGASMTSFAATKGWVQEGEDWVWLDNDGERVYNQWKKSAGGYYYLGEDGVMVKDSLIYDDTVGAYYYVDESGARVTGAWKSVPNEEGVTFGESQTTPTTLYYYFGGTGKAERSTGTINDVKVTKVPTSNRYFGFDTEGRMVSGWQQIPDSNGDLQLYYFGTEDEGWAYTGWQYLEADENLTAEQYDEPKWFYFESNGKAVRGKSKYIGNRYYHFGEDGVMDSDWYFIGTPPTVGNASGKTLNSSTAPIAYASSNGTLSSGWIYDTADGESDLDPHWFYLVSITAGDNKVKRSVPYNYSAGSDSGWVDNNDGENLVVGPRAKVIKNKTYIFDTDGKMLTGFVYVGEDVRSGEEVVWAAAEEGSGTGAANRGQVFSKNAVSAQHRYFNIPGRSLAPGLYYFNKTDEPTSTEGQMQTGRTAITVDGETYYFYFDKSGTQNDEKGTYGRALTNAVKDGYLYGRDGACITAEDGNAYAAYRLKADVNVLGSKNIIDENTPVLEEDKLVIIGRTGRIKQNGTVTIDGLKYKVEKYIATPQQDE